MSSCSYCTTTMASAEGYGSVCWWGFSPAHDLLAANPPRHDELPGEWENVDCFYQPYKFLVMCVGCFFFCFVLGYTEGQSVNILLVGCGDLRHVLQTVARARQHTSATLHVSTILIHYWGSSGCNYLSPLYFTSISFTSLLLLLLLLLHLLLLLSSTLLRVHWR